MLLLINNLKQKKMKTHVITFSFVFLISSMSIAQIKTIDNINVNEYICYCVATSSTPHSIISLDNNWQLLLLLREPMLVQQLDSLNIQYSMSQLTLLENWDLLKRNKDNTYQTSILILDEAKSKNFREYSNLLSSKLVSVIKTDVLKIKDHLISTQRDGNIYSILFSYILDGLVWDILKEKKLIEKNELSLESPLWSGYFWSLYPKREFTCGTNSISDKGYAIKINWSENSLSLMMPFVTRFDLQAKILNDIINYGKIVDKDCIDVFKDYKFFDQNGELTIPVIVEKNSNQLYQLSKQVAEKVVDFLSREIAFSQIQQEFGITEQPEIIVTLYHEILWDILLNLEYDNIIEKPLPFKDKKKAKPEDISNLIFITKKD